jgi:hypothetical protein
MSEEYEYDYVRYEKILLRLLGTMWRDPDDLNIGENISDQPEVKIIFDGYRLLYSDIHHFHPHLQGHRNHQK